MIFSQISGRKESDNDYQRLAGAGILHFPLHAGPTNYTSIDDTKNWCY